MASKFNTSADRISVGQKFGKYTVLEIRSPSSVCRCECGIIKMIRNSFMVAGRVGGCHSCANKRIRPGRRMFYTSSPKHTYRRLSAVVRNIIRRCIDPTHRHWKYYGGRGIRIYKPWIKNSSNFFCYLLKLDGYSDPTLVIDRIDNDRGYMPGNLRFVTKSTSQKNKGPYGRRVHVG